MQCAIDAHEPGKQTPPSKQKPPKGGFSLPHFLTFYPAAPAPGPAIGTTPAAVAAAASFKMR